jgi:signal transduction histidine kinase
VTASALAILVVVLALGALAAVLERWRIARLVARQAELEGAVATAVRDLAAANRELESRNEVDGACLASVDPDRAWEIVDNLVSNALKFSPPGRRVWVRTGCGAAGVRVEVSDEGPGLTSADRERAFRRFQRLSARPTAGESSTGLGLSIVKTLVELHGGTIAIESEPGAGARFVVDLPESDVT